jgi:hypothetical protein
VPDQSTRDDPEEVFARLGAPSGRSARTRENRESRMAVEQGRWTRLSIDPLGRIAVLRCCCSFASSGC